LQGVFFRDSTRRLAQRHGGCGLGWRTVGTERSRAVFEGEADSVDRLVSFSRAGPRGAQVDSVEVIEEEPEDLVGFVVR